MCRDGTREVRTRQERLRCRAPAGSTPAPAYVAIADIFKGGPYVSSGPEKQVAVIVQAQKKLKLLKYYNVPEDGLPNPGLVSALKAWQKSAGFRKTGRIDENSLKGLGLTPNCSHP